MSDTYFKYLINADIGVWGEHGTKSRFVQIRHKDLIEPVTVLLDKSQAASLIEALQQELPPEAYTETHRRQ